MRLCIDDDPPSIEVLQQREMRNTKQNIKGVAVAPNIVIRYDIAENNHTS